MKLTRSQALRKLEHARDQIAALRESSANSPRFQYWNEQTLRLILDLFPRDSSYEKAYRELSFGLLFDPHHRPGAPEHEDTYSESLDKAVNILNDLLVALGAPGAVPSGANLVMEEIAEGPSQDVLVMHGPEDTLVHRITPVIVAAERTRIGVAAWPEDADTLARTLGGYKKPFATLVVVAETDMTPAATGSNDPPNVPEEIYDAIQAAVTAFGEDNVTVIAQSKTPLKPDQVPAKLIRVDSRGYWRKALGRLLESLPS